jgi:hypothetical protein
MCGLRINNYKMIRQFATMANIYQDLIPEKYYVLSILELSDNPNGEDFVRRKMKQMEWY